MPLPSIPNAARSFSCCWRSILAARWCCSGCNAASIAEGKRFAVVSREGALVVNNVMLSAILGVVLFGTLYPLVTEAFDTRVSVGPPYFNPVGAVFFVPMALVMMVGPLLRWRQDNAGRLGKPLILAGLAMFAALLAFVLLGGGGALRADRFRACRRCWCRQRAAAAGPQPAAHAACRLGHGARPFRGCGGACRHGLRERVFGREAGRGAGRAIGSKSGLGASCFAMSSRSPDRTGPRLRRT